ncbi:ribonuclease [Asanoa siamensis]|uniref:Uncharacterized protein n=1 Tax=Asanoa siamensis TaxID=926357 RepID=A0ABQ4D3P4_9ACTN|nr:ribonuclease [Asanoa siamensis]GIF78153.1 hypothetical protein Asi02nite_76710 [Asanoa siamensis]
MTSTPEQDARETGQIFEDAEGRRTTDPGKAVEHAQEEADRNEEHLKRGEVGPRVPEE